MKLSDGGFYEGNWLNDLYDGLGRFVDKNQNVYEGNFN